MKRNELLKTMRPSKQRQAVEMAMRPNGVTTSEMVVALGATQINRIRALHAQGLATLFQARDDSGFAAYYLVTDESLSAQALYAQQLRREAWQRMQAELDADENQQ